MNAAAARNPSPPLTLGGCATLACIWEATAAKPGNVYRGADFDDCSYADFLASAAVLGPVLEQAAPLGVGVAVLRCVEATSAAVGSNTYLGTVLLLAPLAATPADRPLAAGIGATLGSLGVEDAELVYRAIRLAKPGGLGRVEKADVAAGDAPQLTLVEAMRLAADRDLVARQYVAGFADVFRLADRLAAAARGLPLDEAIVRTYLAQLAAEPDSLIARKLDLARAREASARAAATLEAIERNAPDADDRRADLDFWLRADGRRRNPGTTADLIAAALFVVLREQRLNWPVKFY